MSASYLTAMADWLRGDGLAVVEYDGWQTRARSSGGFAAGRPWGIMWHHTASVADPGDDAHYMCHGSPDAPIANLLIARDGIVWVLAAGATNTNGKGGPWLWSKGTVPRDQMNTHAVGIEIANSGVGEPYPQAQIDTAFAASTTLQACLGLSPGDCCTHRRYAPDRKIDPATTAAVQGSWHPTSETSSGTWNLDDLIDEHFWRFAGIPAPTPPTPTPVEDDEMVIVALDQNGTAWRGDGITRAPIPDENTFNSMCLVLRGRLVNVSGGAVAGWDDVGDPVDAATLDALGDAR